MGSDQVGLLRRHVLPLGAVTRQQHRAAELIQYGGGQVSARRADVAASGRGRGRGQVSQLTEQVVNARDAVEIVGGRVITLACSVSSRPQMGNSDHVAELL